MICFDNVYRGRRVLVTGHTGFKGSWLALWLKHLGAEVAGFSVDIPRTPSNFTLLGLEQHLQHYEGDIRDRSHLAQVIDKFKPDIVFHLAAQAGVRYSIINPTTYIHNNIVGFFNF
jgi:CDP-glucose 4,6-dehydratase